MAGRVCLVTGANRGIGRATAIGLARLGARVGMVCRDRERGEAARDEIQGVAGGSVELFCADLAERDSIVRLAREVRDRLPALHVLVNNAGILLGDRTVSPDGLEMTFTVNHLSYFLLTHHLLDHLRAAAPARIVNVSSEAHRSARLDLDDLQAERKYDGIAAYANSKLANILFTYALARRLEGSGVTSNCLHPGVIRTGLLEDYIRETPFWIRWARPLFEPFFRSTERGAETSIHLAAAAEIEGASGGYFARRRAVRSSKQSYDSDLGEDLWKISGELAGV
jgi:NAD(P)-dependent dehydrogenase (short-subunit alcohol dehydrogenase family)